MEHFVGHPLEAKLCLITPNEDWKTTTLPQSLKAIKLNEIQWNSLKTQEQYTVVDGTDDDLIKGTDTGNEIKIVCISDTHGKGKEMKIPEGDILIHAGDFTYYGLVSEVILFNDWLGSLPHKHKIVIAGNHDLTFDEGKIEQCREYMKQAGDDQFLRMEVAQVKSLLTNCTYLENEAAEIMGIKFFGSPCSPMHSDEAFQKARGEELRSLWENVPADTDILMTHTPPAGVGDLCLRKNSEGDLVEAGRAGCLDLMKEIVERIQPKYHIFGHIHEGYGVYKTKNTVFINAASCDKKYKAINPPIVISWSL